jgi:type IV secretory pathway TrbD component
MVAPGEMMLVLVLAVEGILVMVVATEVLAELGVAMLPVAAVLEDILAQAEPAVMVVMFHMAELRAQAGPAVEVAVPMRVAQLELAEVLVL